MPRQAKKNHKSMKVETISLCLDCRTQIGEKETLCGFCERYREKYNNRRSILDEAYRVQLLRHKGLS